MYPDTLSERIVENWTTDRITLANTQPDKAAPPHQDGEGRPKTNLKGEEHVAAHAVFLAR